jgi:hypothetical protein
VKLENFIVVGGFTGTTLFGLGRHWDLHSFAETRSVHFEPRTRMLTLEWGVPGMVNPWGSPGNRARGCRLLFENVLSLRVTDSDPGASPADDVIVADVSRVLPGEAAYSWMEKGAEPERFRLRFRFQSGRKIEVESERARLEPIEGPPGEPGV